MQKEGLPTIELTNEIPRKGISEYSPKFTDQDARELDMVFASINAINKKKVELSDAWDLLSQIKKAEPLLDKALKANYHYSATLALITDLAEINPGEDEDMLYKVGAKKIGLTLLGQNLEVIDRDLSSGYFHLQDYYSLIILMEDGNEASKQKAKEIFLKHLGVLEDGLTENSDTWLDHVPLAIFIWEHVKSPETKKLFLEIKAKLELPIPKRQWEAVANMYSESKHGKVAANVIIEFGLLKRLGLKFADFTPFWELSNINAPNEALLSNIQAIENLEDSQPGITKFLYEKYGIRNFGRYPQDILLKQFEESGGTTKPYGAVIFPVHDRPGILYGYDEVLEQTFKNFKGEYAMRIVECGNPRELFERLFRLKHRYGPMEFAWINAHGSKKDFVLGQDYEKETVNSKHFSPKSNTAMLKAITRLRKCFVSHPKILVMSCRGAESAASPAARISETLEAKTFGIAADSGFDEVKPIKTKAGLDFKVKTVVPGALRIYDKGVLQK